MSISLIVACDMNMGIGYKNELLIKLPNDMKHFRKYTEGNFVVMGRNTYESIGRSLPNRTNIVISRDVNYKPHPSVFVYNSVEAVLWEYNHYGEKNHELMIIGGQSLYEQFMEHANKVYMTLIDHTFDNVDTYFPELDDSWIPISNIKNEADGNNLYNHYFLVYERNKRKLK